MTLFVRSAKWHAVTKCKTGIFKFLLTCSLLTFHGLLLHKDFKHGGEKINFLMFRMLLCFLKITLLMRVM